MSCWLLLVVAVVVVAVAIGAAGRLVSKCASVAVSGFSMIFSHGIVIVVIICCHRFDNIV